MSGKECATTAFGLLLLFCLLVSPVACTIHQDRRIAEAIKAGVDPVAAKCALQSMESRVCMYEMRRQ